MDQTQEYDQANDDNCVLWSLDDCSPFSISTRPLEARSPDQDVMFPVIRKEKVFKDFLPDPKEVLGPVSEVPGHPVTVTFGGLYGIGISVGGHMLKVKGVTMLYRRFRVEQLSNDGEDSATLHTLQLLPTYTQGDLILIFFQCKLVTHNWEPCQTEPCSLTFINKNYNLKHTKQPTKVKLTIRLWL